MGRYKIVFFLIFIFCLKVTLAQQDYKGRVLDTETRAPLPYVNIGVFGKGIGTVSDEEGLFHLPMDKSRLAATDIVQFSSMGYQTIKKAVANLVFVYNEYPEILMQPENVELDEVVVTNSGAYEVNDIVGYQNYGEKAFGYWKENIALGGELATKIRVKKGLRKLDTLFFEVFANPSDSVLIRVNFYDIGKFKSIPGKNLNSSNKNILYTIYPNTKLAIVDLSPNSIYVKNSFFVSLELLKVYGDKPIGLVLAASADNIGKYSLRKYASLDKWEILTESAMAYHLNTTYFSDKKSAERKVARAQKSKQRMSDKKSAEAKVAKAQKSKQRMSGFIFSMRGPLSNIKVKNLSSNEEVFSNDKGRYLILGEKDDIISFEAEGYKKMTIILLEKNNSNIYLLRE